MTSQKQKVNTVFFSGVLHSCSHSSNYQRENIPFPVWQSIPLGKKKKIDFVNIKALKNICHHF